MIGFGVGRVAVLIGLLCMANAFAEEVSDSDLLSAIGFSKAVSGQAYCLRSGRAAYECTGVSWGQGVCLSSEERKSYECSGVGAAEGVCLSGDRASYECVGVSLAQAVCLSGDRPSYECVGVSRLSAICLSGGRPSYECSGIRSLDQAMCLQESERPSYECSGL